MAAPEYLTIVELPVAGSGGTFEFTFAGGYLEREHVKLDFVSPLGVRTNYPLNPVTNFASDFTLTVPLVDLPANDFTARIYRDTPRADPLVNFASGSRITDANLDRLAQQAIFVAAEAFDAGAYAVAEDLIGQALSAIEEAEALIDQAQGIVDTAAASAAGSAASAAQALTHANSALTYRDAAALSAASASASESIVAASAAAAAVSASTASTKAGEAASSASNALASANTATTQAVAAGNSAAAAAGSASTASTQATNAGNSASAASTSATNAATSATSAANSATAAGNSANLAAGYALGLQRVTGAVTRANVNGKVLVISAAGTVTIPSNQFVNGDVFGIENNTSGSITIAGDGSLTLAQAGGVFGSRTLARQGLAVLRVTGATYAYISGPGVS